jgi:tRNA A37 methylthiotransferase MiaB
MRRFGDTERFLDLLAAIRAKAPQAGVRSNFIVGFPGETEDDLAELERFLGAARLDAIGVFGYSDEDGTEAAGYDGKLDDETVAARLTRVSRLAEELTAQRAEERLGDTVRVLVEAVDEETGEITGRADHQAPETDGQVLLLPSDDGWHAEPGTFVTAKVTGTQGVDLVAEPLAADPLGSVPRRREEPLGAAVGR